MTYSFNTEIQEAVKRAGWGPALSGVKHYTCMVMAGMTNASLLWTFVVAGWSLHLTLLAGKSHNSCCQKKNKTEYTQDNYIFSHQQKKKKKEQQNVCVFRYLAVFLQHCLLKLMLEWKEMERYGSWDCINKQICSVLLLALLMNQWTVWCFITFVSQMHRNAFIPQMCREIVMIWHRCCTFSAGLTL